MSKRTRTLGLLGICAICIGALFYLGVKGNVIYYYTVTEAVHKAPSQGSQRFRLAGAVVNNSVKTSGDNTLFKVTDGNKTVTVIHHGDPPELFKEGAPVVSEGHWAKDAAGKVFDSDLIMIKHGSDYTPPKVKQSVKK